MKKLLAFTLALVLALSLAACTLDTPETTTTVAASTEAESQSTETQTSEAQSTEPLPSAPLTSDPWLGLWRYEDDFSVDLYLFKPDGTFINESRAKQEGFLDASVSGSYAFDGDSVKIWGLIVNGQAQSGEQTFDFAITGDTANYIGQILERVPEQYAAAVLADPMATYPPN